MPKAGVGAPLDLQDERSKGGHPLQPCRGIISPEKDGSSVPISLTESSKANYTDFHVGTRWLWSTLTFRIAPHERFMEVVA